MSRHHDHDFYPPLEKGPAATAGETRPNSPLAVVSLVFGILGFVPLPLVGSIIAIVTGHAAMGQIRDEEGRMGGRGLARAGLMLGYIAFAITAAVVVTLAWFTTYAYREIRTTTAVTTPAGADSTGWGVKMVNEMQRVDFKLIEDHKLDVKADEIIACYNAGGPRDNPELALLTTRRILYLKDGRTTVFDLKDIADIMDEDKFRRTYKLPVYSDLRMYDYNIEIRSRQGPRMRLKIEQFRGGNSHDGEGKAFYDALESTWKAAGGNSPDGLPTDKAAG